MQLKIGVPAEGAGTGGRAVPSVNGDPVRHDPCLATIKVNTL